MDIPAPQEGSIPEHAEVAHAGRTAQQDILPVLCPSAMNHATTLRIMERLRADEFTYQVNAAGNLPLALHGLCSMVWRRRVYTSSQQVTARTVSLRAGAEVLFLGNWLSSAALLAPASERVNMLCQALFCCDLVLLASGANRSGQAPRWCARMHRLRQQLWTADKIRMHDMRTYPMSSSMPR